MITWNTVACELAEFEDEYANKLCSLSALQFNAWQIVKSPLYFDIINSLGQKAPQHQGMQVSRGERVIGLLKRMVTLGNATTALTGLRARRRNGAPVLFYTFSADKLAKDAQGRYFNFLVDGFITNSIVDNYVYAELSQNGQIKTPSPVNVHFKTHLLNELAYLHRRREKKNKQLHVASEQLAAWLNEFFAKKQLPLSVSAATVNAILASFAGYLSASLVFLQAVKPALIISSEQPGSGLLAAAIKLNIPMLDLQHGLIDQYHPQYTFSSRLAACKQNMVLPNWVGVFGELHKKILLSRGFWNEGDIVVLGSSRIEMNRHKFSGKALGAGNTILFPTQWTSFEDTMEVLRVLLPALPPNTMIVLKLHPLERQEYVDAYTELAAKNASKLIISEREKDIYPLIHECRLVMAFDSTVLLEAASMGVPSITIATPTLPLGVHSLFHTDDLKQCIKPVDINDHEGLTNLVRTSFSDASFYKDWQRDALQGGAVLYANNYFDNCRHFIQQALPGEALAEMPAAKN